MAHSVCKMPNSLKQHRLASGKLLFVSKMFTLFAPRKEPYIIPKPKLRCFACIHVGQELLHLFLGLGSVQGSVGVRNHSHLPVTPSRCGLNHSHLPVTPSRCGPNHSHLPVTPSRCEVTPRCLLCTPSRCVGVKTRCERR